MAIEVILIDFVNGITCFIPSPNCDEYYPAVALSYFPKFSQFQISWRGAL